jgi:hypothetical protein
MELRPRLTNKRPGGGIEAMEPIDDAALKVAGCNTVGIHLSPEENATRGFNRALNIFVDLSIKFIIAGAVGSALIAPMLIMVLHPSRNTSLITTCVCVVAFASTMVSFNIVAQFVRYLFKRTRIKVSALDGAKLEAMDIITATAAYAAVLVVFVGSSTGPISSS